jgi:hypothetical protein
LVAEETLAAAGELDAPLRRGHFDIVAIRRPTPGPRDEGEDG